MKIVQLSDIHVGSQFREEIFEKVIDEVNALKPDTVVITGDLTNEGLVSEYEKCKDLVSKLNVDKVIAISGNHDYRNTGYLVFKKYFPFQTINELSEDVVLVTLGTARPDRNEGEVVYRQTVRLERTSKKYEVRTTIPAMHHHLIGIPDIGSERVTILDAGDVLRTILDTKVDLVLGGHKHLPWIWRFNNLSIVNAGTTSSDRMRGLFDNTYNIVNVVKNKIQIDLKIIGGQRILLEVIAKTYTRFGAA